VKPVLVITTLNSTDKGEEIAAKLVNLRLAACVNILGPITSYYFWENKLQKDIEYKLFIKSREDLWPEICSFIKKEHPYSVPEILKVEISEADKEYYQWLIESCKVS